jgi:hypothetical protein
LKNQLQGIAAQCIAGLPLTTGNYYQAVDILRENYKVLHAEFDRAPCAKVKLEQFEELF